MLILFSNGHHQIELSSQPCTGIISKQQTEEQQDRLCRILGQERRKRNKFTTDSYRHYVKIKDVAVMCAAEGSCVRK